MNYPKPDRSGHEPNFTKTPENEDLDLGWAEGVLSDGRPYRLECWCADQITNITVFFSRIGLEGLDRHAVQELLEREKLVEFKSPTRRFADGMKYTDYSGQDMWSVNVVVGDEDDTFVSIGPALQKY